MCFFYHGFTMCFSMVLHVLLRFYCDFTITVIVFFANTGVVGGAQ